MSGGAEWALKNRLPNTDCLALLDTRQTMVMMAKQPAPAWLSAARLRPRRWGGAESAQLAPTSVLTDAHYYLAASESSGHSSDQFVKVQVDFITGRITGHTHAQTTTLTRSANAVVFFQFVTQMQRCLRGQLKLTRNLRIAIRVFVSCSRGDAEMTSKQEKAKNKHWRSEVRYIGANVRR